MEDPTLNYVALGVMIFVVVVLFYGIIAIHDIPYRIAESRDHPHQDAIHAAGWVSLFTLHVLWPFLWIWAMAYRPERGWGFSHDKESQQPALTAEIAELRERIANLEARAIPDTLRPNIKSILRKAACRFEDQLRQHDRDRVTLMELILILIYVAFCYAIFKILRIPVNQWSLATATLGGIVGIALLLLVMNYNHPYTKEARIYFSVTPIMAGVKGRVIEVPVQLR